MKITLDPANPQTWPKGRINEALLDATTEIESAAQQTVDEANERQEANQAAQGDFSACVLNSFKPTTV